MAANSSAQKMPHLNRTVMVAPNRRVDLAHAGHPLATMKPTTRLGKVAHDLAMATSTATIQVIATTAYVNSLQALSAPNVIFSTPHPVTRPRT